MTTTRTAQIEAARAADEKIAAAWAEYWEVADRRRPHHDRIKDAQRRFARARTPEQKATWQDRIDHEQAAVRAITAEAEPLAQAAHDLDAELYTGWQRFFLVEHIHSSTRCSSFRITTRVGWLPKVSGLTEAEAVAEYGAILCTICFPSAPIEFTRGVQDDRCSGSGKGIRSDLPRRSGYYSGNWATCPDCGKQVGVTRNGLRIPKHDAVIVTA